MFSKVKNGGGVVLHDIILNHLGDVTEAFSTKVLLSSVVGEKIICRGDENPYNSPGIGVFKITEETAKHIENIFSSLTITWKYMPDAKQLELYRKVYRKYYCAELVDEFNDSVAMNKNTLAKMEQKWKIKKELRSIHELLLKLKNAEKIYIYGCGVIGRKVYDLLESFGVCIEGYVISDNQIKLELNIRIEHISDVKSSECTLVLGMSMENQNEICKENRTFNWVRVSEEVLDYIKKYL